MDLAVKGPVVEENKHHTADIRHPCALKSSLHLSKYATRSDDQYFQCKERLI